MSATDKTEIDKLIKAFYAAFTTTGERVDSLRTLFDQKGQVIQFLPDEAKHFTFGDFVSSRQEILSTGTYKDFKEYELDSETVVSGRHAVRISNYQKEGKKDGKAFRIIGTKVFRLLKVKSNWKILSFTWMDNSASRPIELRLVTEHDAQLLFDLMTAENWLNHIGDRGIKTLADARQYIADKMHPDLHEKGFVNHVIIDSETKEEVGTCSLHNREGVEGLDVGYAILEKYEGKGYATTSAKKMVELAFEKYQVQSIKAITTDNNIGSCRVLEKLGFMHQAYIISPTSKEKLKLYSLEKNYWVKIHNFTDILK